MASRWNRCRMAGELTWRQFLRQERKLRRMAPSVRIVRNTKQGCSKSFRRLDLRSKVVNASELWVRAATPRFRTAGRLCRKKLAKLLRDIIASSRPRVRSKPTAGAVSPRTVRSSDTKNLQSSGALPTQAQNPIVLQLRCTERWRRTVCCWCRTFDNFV